MKKIIFSLVALVILAGGGAYYYFNIYSEQMNEADYTMSVPDAKAEISIATDKIMTCKGFAMMNRERSKVDKCFSEYLSKYGSQFDIAAQEFFSRAKSSEKFKNSPTGKGMLRKIAMQQDAMNYISNWLKKN